MATAEFSKFAGILSACQVHESRQIGSGQIRDGKSEHRHSRNQQTKMDGNERFNSDDIISSTVGKNPLEEME